MTNSVPVTTEKNNLIEKRLRVEYMLNSKAELGTTLRHTIDVVKKRGIDELKTAVKTFFNAESIFQGVSSVFNKQDKNELLCIIRHVFDTVDT